MDIDLSTRCLKWMRKSVSEQLLRKYEPKITWLKHDSNLHGVGHMTRVLILQELICNVLYETGVKLNRTALRYASMAHDVGRIDDGYDPEHGRRSVAWMNQHLTNKMSPEDLDVATYIVHWHVPPDNEAPVMTPELKVLKDADGLDRVRLNDLDTNYLRIDGSKGLVDIAQQLHRLSCDDGKKDSFEAVISAAKQMRIVTFVL